MSSLNTFRPPPACFSKYFLEPPNMAHFAKLKCTKSRKTIRPWSKSHQFWRWLLSTYMSNFGLFMQSVLLRILKPPISWSFFATSESKSKQYWMSSWYTCMPNFRPFLQWMPWNPNYTKFFNHQRAKIGPILTKIDSFLGVVRIHPPAIFRAILSMHFLGMLENSTLQSFLATRGPLLIKIESLWKGLGYIDMLHFRPFLPCIFLWMP